MLMLMLMQTHSFNLRWLTRVEEVYAINVQISLFFFFHHCSENNKNPYIRPLLLQITVWEVRGARNGKTVHE